MNKIYSKLNFFIIVVLSAIFFLSSCGTRQNATYFSDLDSLKLSNITTGEFKEPIIHTDDILNISVQTMGQDAFASGAGTSVNSTAGDAQAVTQSNSPGNGFLVSKSGTIEMPMLGIIQVAGLTTSQAIDVIRTTASKYYKAPTVQVRIANFKITILGEVVRPASYTIPYEKITIMDAIAMAGDITLSGKKNNVLLLRENGDKKDIVRLNLNSSNIISSPYFYLKQNDVLYIEPTKNKVAASNAQNTQLITIGLSVAALLITILINL